MLRAVKERNKGPLSDETLVRLFREIMVCLFSSAKAFKYCLFRPQGTFSEMATYKYFGHSVAALPVTSIDNILQS